MTARPAVAFRAAEKRFADGTRALAGVSFQVAAGEFCVILGPSGSGKSTLLRCVNGLVRLDGCAVWVDGRELSPRTLPAIRRRVAMIFQQYALVERASVAHNVIAGAAAATPAWRALLGLYPRADRRKACALLEAVGLEPRHMTRRVGELSGGQQQRVGIARAFMCDPAIILADEPVASLDPATSREIMALLRDRARAGGAAVLCSLHQFDLALEFADRIVALRSGEVVFDGAPTGLTSGVAERIYGGRGARPAPAPPIAVLETALAS